MHVTSVCDRREEGPVVLAGLTWHQPGAAEGQGRRADRAAFPWGRQKKENRWFEFLIGRRKAYTTSSHAQLQPCGLQAVASDGP